GQVLTCGRVALDLSPPSCQVLRGGEGAGHDAPRGAIAGHHEVGIACHAFHDCERAIIDANGEDFTVDADLVGLMHSSRRHRPEDDPEASRAPTRAKFILWRILTDCPNTPAAQD